MLAERVIKLLLQKHSIPDDLARLIYWLVVRDEASGYQSVSTMYPDGTYRPPQEYDPKKMHIPYVQAFDFILSRLPQLDPNGTEHSTVLELSGLSNEDLYCLWLTQPHGFGSVKIPPEWKDREILPHITHTIWHPVLTLPVSFSYPKNIRFEHTHLLGQCLHPDTPIFDPVDRTTHTVYERFLLAKPFHVFSLHKDGHITIGRAEPPRRFFREPMVKMTSAFGSFSATRNHRVWNGHAYVTLQSYFPSSSFRLPSISGNVLSMLTEDVKHYLETHEGSPVGYRPSPHLYGLQLPREVDGDQAFVLQQADAHELCCGTTYTDDLGRTPKHTRFYQDACRLSMQGSIRPESSILCRESGHQLSSKNYKQSCLTFSPFSLPEKLKDPLYIGAQFPLPFHQKHADESDEPLHPAPLSIEVQSLLQYREPPQPHPDHSPQHIKEQFDLLHHSLFFSFTNTITWTHKQVEDEYYYDFHVREHQNYFACGLFHHNTGSGKTTYLESAIWNDLQEDCTVIVMTPKGKLIPDLFALKEIDPIILRPEKEYPLSLNLFDIGEGESAVELIHYCFTSILEVDPTGKQTVLLNNCIRLLLTVPGATLFTLGDLVQAAELPQKYEKYVAKLTEKQQKFFATQFNDKKQYDETKRNLIWRFDLLLDKPIIQTMFSQPKTKFSMEKAFDGNSVVLIDTAERESVEVSRFLGRFFIVLMVQAFQKRKTRNPVFIYIDEAADYLNESITVILEKAREARVGLTLAHQQLQQLRKVSTELEASIITNTSTKIIGGCSYDDARVMAREIGLEPEELQHQPVFTFTRRVKGFRPMQMRVQPGFLNGKPQKTRAEIDDLIQRNRKTFTGTPPTPEPEPPEPEDNIERRNRAR